MRRVTQLAFMEEKRKAYIFLLGNLKEGHCLEERCVEWILILKLSLKTEDGGLTLDLSGSGQRQFAGYF